MTQNTKTSNSSNSTNGNLNNWALLCQGGGGKGSWEAGFIYQIANKHKIDFISLIGTSVGALNCALYLQCIADGNFNRYIDVWHNVDSNTILIKDKIKGLCSLLTKIYYSDSNELRCLIQKNINPTAIQNVIIRKKKFLHIYTTNIHNLLNWVLVTLCFTPPKLPPGKCDLFSDLHNGLLASASIPLAFPSVRLLGTRLYDGGLCANNPVGPGSTILGISNVLILSPVNKDDLAKVKFFDVLNYQLLSRMIKTQDHFRRFNSSGLPTPNVYFVTPTKRLNIKTLNFTKSASIEGFKLGQADADTFIATHSANYEKYDLMQYCLNKPRLNIIKVLECCGLKIKIQE